ncbi:unnamed protein product, partial [Staurois parvus]
MGTRCFGGEPPFPETPPHVEGMWPDMVQEGGRLLVPPLFLACRAACLDKFLGLGGGMPFFFFYSKSISDLKGLVWMGG